MVHFDKMAKDKLVDVINEYEIYFREKIGEGLLPVDVTGFYMAEYQDVLKNRARQKTLVEAIRNTPGTFEYGGYHFAPYRAFYKGEADKRLENDSRPWKYDIQYETRNMRADNELGMTKQKSGFDGNDFVAAAGASVCDIYFCVENGKLYVPYVNILFEYTEPPYQERLFQAVKLSRTTYKEPDAQSPIGIFLSNVGSYDGKNRGTWLNLPARSDNLRTALTRIGAKDGKFAIVAAKGMEEAAIDHILPTSHSLDELNMLAQFMKNMEDWEVNKLEAIIRSGVSGVDDVPGLINLLYEDNFTGFDVLDLYSYEELGRYRETVDADGIPEGMDYAEYGQHCEIEEKGKLTELGYVHQRFKMQPIYDNDITERYKIVDAATAELLKSQQKPSRKPKKSVLAALDKGKEKVAQADAARAAQDKKPPARKRGGQEQGD
jgi:hypothetical protein